MGLMTINIWVTTKCNFNCIYCYEKKNIYEKKDMSYQIANDTAKFIVNFLAYKKISNCNINFHGGEPLINNGIIWLIIEKLNQNKNCKYKFSMTTNGSLLNEDIIAKFLIKLDKISVSLDGNRDTFYKNRNNNISEVDFKHIIQNTILMQSKGINTVVRMTLRPEQVSLFFENIKFFINLGLVKIDYALDIQNSIWNMGLLDDLLKQIRRVRKYIKDYNLKADIDGIEPEILHECGICQGGISNLNIDIDGNIYPCVFATRNNQFVIGNIYNGIDSGWFFKLKMINNIEMKACKGCNFLPCCMGKKCKIFNYILTGDYGLTSENVCLLQNFKYNLSKII